jgi:hypothetical protein
LCWKLSYSSSFFCFQWPNFYSFILEALWFYSLQPIISFCQDHVLSLLIHLTGALCPLFKFFSSYQVLLLFSTGVLPKFLHSHSSSILSHPEWFWILPCFMQLLMILHPLKVLCFHSFVQEATYDYLFLFLFSVLDLGARSLVSGGEL